jgi:GMP synthase-like glutamine amidotransferase
MNIGLSQRVLLHKNRAYDALEHGWYSYLKAHTLFPIANRPNQNFNKLANELDCFIITGGDDSTVRRLTEMRLATHMIARQKPVIGICHGAFLLTELLGGEINNSKQLSLASYKNPPTISYNIGQRRSRKL